MIGEKKKIAFHKSGPSDLLVDKTRSIVKLIIFVLLFVVKDESPIPIFKSGNCWYYLTIYDQFHLNCSGVCCVHDDIKG